MQTISIDDGYRIKKTDIEGGLTIVGDLTVMGLSTEIFSLSELALIDIIPKIMDTHPDLYLKYIDMIPEKK